MPIGPKGEKRPTNHVEAGIAEIARKGARARWRGDHTTPAIA